MQRYQISAVAACQEERITDSKPCRVVKEILRDA